MQEDFWNSGVFVPVNLDQIAKDADKPDKEKWMTEEGFIYPGTKSALEDNENRKKPDELRAEEIHSFVRELAWIEL